MKIQVKDTKQLILDTAERLFAQKGFHATSMRDITGTAGVNLSSVNYHFGSKDALLESVFERRLVPLNEKRMEALRNVVENAKTKRKRPKVHEIMRAFIDPTIRFRESGEGAEDFIALVGQSLAAQDGTVRRVFIQRIIPVFGFLTAALREALPDLPEKKLAWRLHFAMGALSQTMHACTGTCHTEMAKLEDNNIKSMMTALCHSSTTSEELSEMLTSFIVAGMEAP